jgi:hypothetical protein
VANTASAQGESTATPRCFITLKVEPRRACGDRAEAKDDGWPNDRDLMLEPGKQARTSAVFVLCNRRTLRASRAHLKCFTALVK